MITDSTVSTLEPGAPGQPVETLETPQATSPRATSTQTPEPETDRLRPIPVEQVQILSGYASPIPALVSVTGTWPDLCAQLAHVSQPVIHHFQIEMTLLATPADPACPTDRVGLPFYVEIPINWIELAEGAYTVTVNGRQPSCACWHQECPTKKLPPNCPWGRGLSSTTSVIFWANWAF